MLSGHLLRRYTSLIRKCATLAHNANEIRLGLTPYEVQAFEEVLLKVSDQLIDAQVELTKALNKERRMKHEKK